MPGVNAELLRHTWERLLPLTLGSHKHLLKLLFAGQCLLLIAVEFAVLPDTCITAFYVWIKGSPTNVAVLYMFIVRHNNSKLFVLWGECYLTAILVSLSAGQRHMSCQECVYTRNCSQCVAHNIHPGQQWCHAAAGVTAHSGSVLLLLLALPFLSATT